ncbi:cysteine/serine endopeptidase inhibitor (plasmid) [Streptomyces sp. AHU1]|uniref:cysteine/serine endopeptidase inhibitor n=1 Tax=Streptomyces sp. AHU1 TaxID=3377215 RepID=UPI003878212E
MSPEVLAQPITGKMTYYNDHGYGACGTVIDASSQDLVAVPASYWTAANPNEDKLCKGVSVQVTYNGKTITVPVKDQCPTCGSNHLDLSQTAFQKLAPLARGLVTGITWSFVNGPASAPAPPSPLVREAGSPTPQPSAPAAPRPSTSHTTPSPRITTSSSPSSPTPAITFPPSPSSDGHGGTFRIVGSGDRCVDIPGGHAADGVRVELHDCNDSKSQRWTIAPDGSYRSLGKCLDPVYARTMNGTDIQVYRCNGLPNEEWRIGPNKSLVNVKSGRCLDARDHTTANGSRLQLWDCTGGSNQRWSLLRD